MCGFLVGSGWWAIEEPAHNLYDVVCLILLVKINCTYYAQYISDPIALLYAPVTSGNLPVHSGNPPVRSGNLPVTFGLPSCAHPVTLLYSSGMAPVNIFLATK